MDPPYRRLMPAVTNVLSATAFSETSVFALSRTRNSSSSLYQLVRHKPDSRNFFPIPTLLFIQPPRPVLLLSRKLFSVPALSVLYENTFPKLISNEEAFQFSATYIFARLLISALRRE